MTEAVKIEKYSIEEFYALTEDIRAELINGVIYDMSPAPGTGHQRLSGELFFALKAFVKNKGGKCEVFHAPFDVKLNEDTVVQPDISVICDRDKLTSRGCDGAPDMVIEITSSNPARDYITKAGLYYEAGVREYWIVDPDNKRVSVYLMEENFSLTTYSFTEDVPVGIYGGELTINVAALLSE